MNFSPESFEWNSMKNTKEICWKIEKVDFLPCKLFLTTPFNFKGRKHIANFFCRKLLLLRYRCRPPKCGSNFRRVLLNLKIHTFFIELFSILGPETWFFGHKYTKSTFQKVKSVCAKFGSMRMFFKEFFIVFASLRNERNNGFFMALSRRRLDLSNHNDHL